MTRYGLTLVCVWLIGCGSGTNTLIIDGGTDTPIKIDMPTTGGGKETGEPCTADSECANGTATSMKARCLKTYSGVTYTNGYCSATGCSNTFCAQNQTGNCVDRATLVNTVCSGNATCIPQGSTPRCFRVCARTGDCNVIRDDEEFICVTPNGGSPGYCENKALSDCDPTKAGICNGTADLGVAPDGGVAPNQRTCESITTDNTGGQCVPSCSLFSGKGCSTLGDGCYFQPATGEGRCVPEGFAVTDAGAPKEGSVCQFLNGCQSGYGCLGGKCRKFCNTANAATQCAITKIGTPGDGGTDDAFTTQTRACVSIGVSGLPYTEATLGICDEAT